ncbi:MAG TPA: hypothetical protein VF121_09245 [Thermoanaerobaculia bacterium]|nr:hypothetical protein [Thermoanaerobaculia bacterium]
MSTRVLFGGAVALILLALYVYLVFHGLLIVRCVTAGGDCTAADFKQTMAAALAMIGGLVSALVIAELSVTEPGKTPAARVLSADSSTAAKSGLKVVAFVYLAVWLATGLAAFVFASLQHPETLQPLTDLGQSWLGLAVAAAYAYLGIDPSRRTNG